MVSVADLFPVLLKQAAVVLAFPGGVFGFPWKGTTRRL